MATIKFDNVSDYDAGGTGDYIVPDGYIKTVEKVWIDSYSVSAAIPTTSSLLIARIPKNKKVTDIVIHMPVVGSPATASTIYCCTGATTATTTFFGKLVLGGEGQKTTFDCGTAATLKLNGVSSGFMTPLSADTGVYIVISPATTITGGTIKTIVRYT